MDHSQGTKNPSREFRIERRQYTVLDKITLFSHISDVVASQRLERAVLTALTIKVDVVETIPNSEPLRWGVKYSASPDLFYEARLGSSETDAHLTSSFPPAA